VSSAAGRPAGRRVEGPGGAPSHRRHPGPTPGPHQGAGDQDIGGDDGCAGAERHAQAHIAGKGAWRICRMLLVTVQASRSPTLTVCVLPNAQVPYVLFVYNRDHVANTGCDPQSMITTFFNHGYRLYFAGEARDCLQTALLLLLLLLLMLLIVQIVCVCPLFQTTPPLPTLHPTESDLTPQSDHEPQRQLPRRALREPRSTMLPRQVASIHHPAASSWCCSSALPQLPRLQTWPCACFV